MKIVVIAASLCQRPCFSIRASADFMDRRNFLAGCATGGVLGASVAGAADLSPTDLRPAKPIGLAKPNRAVSKETVARCVVKEPSAIKILQLTDIHFFCDRKKRGEKADQRTQDDLARLVERHQPDLIAFTGDVWHDPAAGMSDEIFAYALAAMTKLDTPWLFNWGNHDLLDDYTEAQAALTEAPKSLYRGAYEGGNHSVLLENAESRPLWDLICLNTTTQGVQEAQENWLRQVVANDDRPKVGGAFCFLHIPLLEYAKVWDSGKAQGVKQEEVCTYGEDGSAFPILKKLGVRACFCGHDHVNDYTGRIGEVDMVYGRASGHAGYGGEQMRKGGKLITLDALKGSYRWQTVFADGSSWPP
jgi:hypothetical protein